MTSHDTMSLAEPAAPSYYEQLGGAPTVRQAVDRFYQLVLSDPELVGYFSGVDVARVKAHQVKLISQVLGGPSEYSGRELAAAHDHLGITEPHFHKVGHYLTGVLESMGASEEIVTAVGSTLAGVAPQIVTAPGA